MQSSFHDRSCVKLVDCNSVDRPARNWLRYASVIYAGGCGSQSYRNKDSSLFLGHQFPF